MSIKQAVRTLLERRNGAVALPEHRYLADGMRPWSPDYLLYRDAVIRGVLREPSYRSAFADGSALPDGYGVSLDERCVEYPWAFSRLGGDGPILDAGSTLNYTHLLAQPALAGRPMTIATLAPERNQQYHRGPSYLFADLRDIPIKDDFYDTIVCISTLEHVGLDNAAVTGSSKHAEFRPDSFTDAVRELRRVLRPSGRLLLTVPYGRHTNMGWQQQFDAEFLAEAIEAFGPAAPPAVTYYRYAETGWQVSTAEACADAAYVRWISDAWSSDVWPDPLPVEEDRAAAARAVACVALRKP